MTTEERTALDRKIDAEIAKLLAETTAISESLRLQNNKLGAEIGQLKMQTIVAPFLAAAAVIGATAAVVKLFF